MEDKDQIIKDLKAELYDMGKATQNLSNILSDIAKELQVPEKGTLEDLGRRIQELIALENEYYGEDDEA